MSEETERILERLAKLVVEMRDAQKRYFRHREPDVLERSKDLEKKVDEICRSVLDTQGKLF